MIKVVFFILFLIGQNIYINLLNNFFYKRVNCYETSDCKPKKTYLQPKTIGEAEELKFKKNEKCYFKEYVDIDTPDGSFVGLIYVTNYRIILTRDIVIPYKKSINTKDVIMLIKGGKVSASKIELDKRLQCIERVGYSKDRVIINFLNAKVEVKTEWAAELMEFLLSKKNCPYA